MGRRTWWSRCWIAGVAAVFAVALAACNPTDNSTGDGLTPVNAGASCWGIKQTFPSSPSGIYWLYNQSQDRPAQFYCDMVTDGGGWVLIGRGREGWNFKPSGQGTAGGVRNNVTGSAAFVPAALSPDLITGLLGGAALTSLPDGIRIERATNTSGSTFQEMRLMPTYATWTWGIPDGQKLAGIKIDGTSYTNGNTRDTGAAFYDYPSSNLQGQSGTKRMRTYGSSVNNWQQGFAFGSGVSGSSSSTSYIWRQSNGWAIPFSRVWLRPQIANGTAFGDIPNAGFAADPNPAGLKNTPEPAPFGVVGVNHSGEPNIEPYDTSANVIKAYGSRVFVGGRFTGVQAGPGGAVTPQKSLAAFDLDGNFIPSFNPVIDGRVWDMTMTADGKLIIGGDFYSVDGQPNTDGLAALDPNTGEVIPSWHATIDWSGGRAIVRALDTRGGWIYAAGRFTTVTGGTWNPLTVSSAISLSTTDGSPGTWRPRLDGSAVRLRVANAGDRVHIVGYFASVNSDTNMGYHAVTDIATGNPIAGMGPWIPSGGSSAWYQQAVVENGSEIVVGGSEHITAFYNHDRTALLDADITKAGGDTQALENLGGWIYVGCHCGDSIFQGTNDMDNPHGFRAVAPINLVGRLNPTTRNIDPTWFPAGLKGPSGEGVWSVTQDQRGCVWVAGDLTQGATTGTPSLDWLGGFGRFCPTDSTPPSMPTGLVGTADSGGVHLSWNPSSDDSGSVSYDVYRNNRVIASVGGTTFTDPAPIATSAYTVRAHDPSGNRSASLAPIRVAASAPVLETPIAFGSTWRYQGNGSDQGTAWRASGFNDSSWPTGPAQFGWGTGSEATTLASQPLTSYYRRTFTLTDPTHAKDLRLGLKVNAGAVVYLNGTEVGRVNMPAGAITATTPAAAYICCSEETRVKPIDIPASLLTTTNTLAVEMHAWQPGASRALFDLTATSLGAGGDTQAPSNVTVTATPGTISGINLSWTTANDAGGVGGYQLVRNGQVLALVAPDTASWSDQAVTAGTSYSYTVKPYDTSGNTSSSNTATVVAPTNAQLVSMGSTWRWYYSSTDPVTGWTGTSYDDSTWASGAGELGFGDTPKATIITGAPAPHPITSYYRRTVTITNPSQFTSVTLGLIRNSGAAVYVNGVEVARDNLPAGPLTSGTYATTAIPTAQRHVPVTFTIPTSAFTVGDNTIAVEIHLNAGSQTTSGLDLSLTGNR